VAKSLQSNEFLKHVKAMALFRQIVCLTLIAVSVAMVVIVNAEDKANTSGLDLYRRQHHRRSDLQTCVHKNVLALDVLTLPAGRMSVQWPFIRKQLNGQGQFDKGL